MPQTLPTSQMADHEVERVTFSFGANWRKFLEQVGEEQIGFALESLRGCTGLESLAGQSFLDLGCGSGLFSLAAFQLGAASVLSIDVDPQCVECCRQLRARANQPAGWEVRQGSVLDRGFLAALPRASLVYSWGVLHHTGALWDALRNAAALVQPGGLFAVALYNRTRQSGRWLAVKRLYNRLPRPFQALLRAGLATALLGALLAKGRDPLDYVRGYAMRNRGMSFWRDIEDWLGGLPYEFAAPEEVRAFLLSRGFELLRLHAVRGIGCNEYLFRKTTEE